MLGPYRNRGRYRLVVRDEGGRKSVVAPSLAAALALKAELERALAAEVRAALGLPALIGAYGRHLRDRTSPEQAAAQVAALARLFRGVPGPAAALSPERAQALYRAETERVSARTGRRLAPDSHRLTLSRARALFRFAVAERITAHNPFDAVRPVGVRRAGKPQLRIDEARAWLGAALSAAAGGDALALAAALLLLLGLRSGEVLARTARDVDDDGQVLWVPRGKTRHARRRLLVPASVRGLLLALARGRAPDALLFGACPDGGPRPRASMHKKVRALCDRAGVPRVCPHSLGSRRPGKRRGFAGLRGRGTARENFAAPRSVRRGRVAEEPAERRALRGG